MTSADIIIDALTAIGEISRGQTPSPEDLDHGLVELNDMIATWSNERLSLFTVQRNKYLLTANQQDYTVGPTASDFVQSRPLLIESAVIILGS